MRQYIYELNEHQKLILNELLKLPTENLYYYTVQQKIRRNIFSLNELKKHITRSIKEYVKRKDQANYCDGKENVAIKYIAFFETTRDFFETQHTKDIGSTNFYSGFHFHLFVSGVKDDYIDELTYQLNSQKLRRGCISKIDGRKKEELSHDFILYHTKQMMFRYSPQLILKNFKIAA